MDYESRIKSFGEVFANLLDEAILRDVLAYVDSGQHTLALETLCDHLCQIDFWLSPEEYEDLVALGEHFGADMDRITRLEERIGYAVGDPALPEEWTNFPPHAVLLPAIKLSPRQLLALTQVLYFGSLNLLRLQKIFFEAPRVLVTDFYRYQLEKVSEVLQREGIPHEIIHAELVTEPAIAEGLKSSAW